MCGAANRQLLARPFDAIMPDQTMALIRQQIQVKEIRVVGIAVQDWAVDGGLVVVDPTPLLVEKDTEIRAAVRRRLAKLVVGLEKRRHSDSHPHVKPLW